eukprot:COSAG02_NODE_6671_length_3427_cov_2.969050_5_plen_168_part_00
MRPDLEAGVASGFFDICIEMVAAFALAGADGVQDTNPNAIVCALRFLPLCARRPGCEAKIRGIAPALGFCLDHSIESMEELGNTTGAMATRVCCSVFGRDEKGSEFTFSQQCIDSLIETWSSLVRISYSYRANQKPSSDTIYAAELCVSDQVSDSSGHSFITWVKIF